MSVNLKELIKLVTPPLFARLYWRYKYGQSPQLSTKGFWEGVYEDFSHVQTAGSGYESVEWLNKMREFTENVLAESRKGGSVPQIATGERSLLAVVASLLCHFNRPERVKILDFGGGMGVDYIRVVSSLAQCSSAIDYHVVDMKSSCEVGTQIFAGDARIHFHDSLPPALAEVDIVFINSGLIFVEDYLTILDALCAYQPKCFLFLRLDAGDIPTHARAQKNVEGSVFPCWFFNLDEIKSAMSAKGYSVIFKGAAEQVYDESNYTEQYRLGRACNLLFARRD